MPAPSSISSSDLPEVILGQPAGTLPMPRLIPSSLAIAARRCPSGLVFAAGLGLLIHLAAATVYVTPVARAGLRDKVRALTRHRRPSLIIAGDSRFESAVMPQLLSSRLGLAEDQVINMAEAACDTPAVLAACREFESRFAESPVFVVNVSGFGANDGATQIVGDELLWSLDFAERRRLAGLGRAVCGCFLPEKAAWADLIRFWPSGAGHSESGFEAVPGHNNVARWSPDYLERRARGLAKYWYSNPDLDGTRWKQLVRDLETLEKTEGRLVVVLMPIHPAFLEILQDTPAGRAELAFRSRVRALCERLAVPCLAYDADCLQPGNPDLLYHDLVHLNRDGAAVFTSVLARDLAPIVSMPVQSASLRDGG